MKQKSLAAIITTIMILPLMLGTVYANSSWVWFTENPITILPWVIIGTLLIEVLVIFYLNPGLQKFRTAAIIIVANICSFLLPYILIGDELGVGLGFFDNIEYYTDKMPFYIVGIGFLVLTLGIEVPIVYNLLKKEAKDEKRLFRSIVGVNVATTIIVAIIERILFKGTW